MKKQYIFIGLILILCYLIFLIGQYKLGEYRIMKKIEELSETNTSLEVEISQSIKTLEKIQTAAYINKSLKKDAGLLSPAEESVTLISENQYKTYITPKQSYKDTPETDNIDPNSSESLIATMTNYQKWIYFFFKKDIR